MTDPIGVDELLAEADSLRPTLSDPVPPAPKLTGPKAPAPRRKPPRPADDPVAAPHGWTYDNGKWRARRPAGRPAGKAKGPGRVTATPAAPASAQAAKMNAATIGRAAAELVESIGMLGAAVPLPPSPLRVRARLQASILVEHAGAIGQAAAKAAPHVPWVERTLSKLAGGAGGAWVLPVVLALAPVAIASVEVWRTPVDDTMAKAAQEVEESAQAQFRAMFAAVTAAAPPPAQDAP